MTRPLLFAAAAALCLFVASSRARAQTPHQEARHAFDLGLQLYDEHRYDAALAQLSRAYELEPNYAVLYNLGLVHAALGHAVEATDALERYLREGGSRIDDAHRQRAGQELERQRERIGTVHVTVNVDGAIVAVDGHDAAGRSPLDRAIRVSVGSHSMVARAPGYEHLEQNVSVAGGQTVELRFDLRTDEAHGLLSVQASIPGADVTIDQENVGRTPLDEAIPVTPGAHHVHVARDGYLPFDADVDVRLGGTRDVRVRLDLDPDALRAGRVGHLTVRVPGPSQSAIDGNPVYRPEDWDLPLGEHELVVDAAGRQRWTGNVTIERGQTLSFAPPMVWTEAARAQKVGEANGQRTLGWAFTIAGGVLTAGAATLLGWNMSTLNGEFNHNEAVLNTCGSNFTCPDGRMHRDIDDRQRALTDQLNAVWWVVGIAGTLGIAGVVIGLVELLGAPSDEAIDRSAHARLRLRPRIDGFAVEF